MSVAIAIKHIFLIANLDVCRLNVFTVLFNDFD